MNIGQVLLQSHMREDEREIMKQQQKAAKKAKKRGMWSAVGGKLGTLGAGLLFSGMGPAGMIAAKMAMGRLGREIGQHAAGDVDTSKIKGKHGFYNQAASDARQQITDFDKDLNKEQWMTSVVNPLMEMGTAEALKMGKGIVQDIPGGEWLSEKTKGAGTDALKGKKGFHWMFRGAADPETGVDIGSLAKSGMSLGDYQQLVSDRQGGYSGMEDDDWLNNMEDPVVSEQFTGPWAQPTQY